jgi:hypothetical protein
MRLPANVVSLLNSISLSTISPEHTGHNLDLGNAMGVTENDTNLRGRSTLPGELADLLNDLVGGGLEPRRRSARVGEGGGRDTLALAVKTTHIVGCVGGGAAEGLERNRRRMRRWS